MDTARTERLLAAILIQNLRQQSDKIAQLSGVGFSNVEIADLVGTTTAVVGQTLYSARKARGSTRRKSIKRKR